MPVDVPAYVLDPPRIENHVQVVGGNNWDISRSARVTPLVVILPSTLATNDKTDAAEDLAKGKVPPGPPILTVQFSEQSSSVPGRDRARLLKLSKNSPLVIVGHADARESDADRLSRARVDAIATLLRAEGFLIVLVKAVGTTQPTLDSGKYPAQNRVVEVFRMDL